MQCAPDFWSRAAYLEVTAQKAEGLEIDLTVQSGPVKSGYYWWVFRGEVWARTGANGVRIGAYLIPPEGRFSFLPFIPSPPAQPQKPIQPMGILLTDAVRADFQGGGGWEEENPEKPFQSLPVIVPSGWCIRGFMPGVNEEAEFIGIRLAFIELRNGESPLFM